MNTEATCLKDVAYIFADLGTRIQSSIFSSTTPDMRSGFMSRIFGTSTQYEFTPLQHGVNCFDTQPCRGQKKEQSASDISLSAILDEWRRREATVAKYDDMRCRLESVIDLSNVATAKFYETISVLYELRCELTGERPCEDMENGRIDVLIERRLAQARCAITEANLKLTETKTAFAEAKNHRKTMLSADDTIIPDRENSMTALVESVSVLVEGLSITLATESQHVEDLPMLLAAAARQDGSAVISAYFASRKPPVWSWDGIQAIRDAWLDRCVRISSTLNEVSNRIVLWFLPQSGVPVTNAEDLSDRERENKRILDCFVEQGMPPFYQKMLLEFYEAHPYAKARLLYDLALLDESTVAEARSDEARAMYLEDFALFADVYSKLAAVRSQRRDAMDRVFSLQGEFEQVTNVAHANFGAGC